MWGKKRRKNIPHKKENAGMKGVQMDFTSSTSAEGSIINFALQNHQLPQRAHGRTNPLRTRNPLTQPINNNNIKNSNNL